MQMCHLKKEDVVPLKGCKHQFQYIAVILIVTYNFFGNDLEIQSKIKELN